MSEGHDGHAVEKKDQSTFIDPMDDRHTPPPVEKKPRYIRGVLITNPNYTGQDTYPGVEL